MKSRSRFSSSRVSGSDFVKTFKSRSQIFKQGSRRRLGESRILPFATPIILNQLWFCLKTCQNQRSVIYGSGKKMCNRDFSVLIPMPFARASSGVRHYCAGLIPFSRQLSEKFRKSGKD